MAALRSIALAALCVSLYAQTPCPCDPDDEATRKLRQCSLCNEADKQPPDVVVFLLKDISPRKPNRWLALPRRHVSHNHEFHELPKAERAAVWKAAIAKGRDLFGDNWGLAYNGVKVRTQCHTHIHIGRLIPLAAIHTNRYVVVSRPEEIPVTPGEGAWIHPVGNKLHVHQGEQANETVLFR